MSDNIQFLKELQHELKTQENDGQAAPRYWTVGDYKMVDCLDGCHDEYYVNAPNREYSGEINALLEYIKSDEMDELSSEATGEFYEIECDDSAIEWLKKHYDEDAELIPVKEVHFVHPNTMFLTKAEAKRHIELNHYNYSPKAHTYAMTAWRAPKVERLLKILETFDFDRLEQMNEIKVLCQSVSIVQEKVERYEKALEFYARKLNYSQSTVDQDIPVVNKDAGEIARNALKG